MELKKLISGMQVKKIAGTDEILIRGITYSSLEVLPGFLFGAMRGFKTDGHRFIKEALEKGAAAVLCEEVPPLPGGMNPVVAFLQVENSRNAFAQVACRYYGDSSLSMGVIGVTGTNGKTTTSFLIRSLLESKGKVGLIGTVGNWIGDEKEVSAHTTPESSDLQHLFHEMKTRGIQNVVMEVSSHSLALERVAGTSFDTVIFTNLTRDHLEFHQTMENYFQAKSRLFTTDYPAGSKERNPLALINIDDPWGERLKSISSRKVWSYGLRPGADLRARDILMSGTGTSFQIDSPRGVLHIHSPLLGTFNVYNLLAAAGAGIHHSVPLNVIEETLGSAISVPGRLEKVPGKYPITVLVDYAHTEDALLKILNTIHEVKEGKIILVFGCGGDRDKGKRPRMGAVAGELADRLFLTSDNPRSEDPLSILKEVEAGVLSSGAKQYRLIVDRREAIEAAIHSAGAGDLVLIAGKGHEDYQIIGETKLEFNDLQVAKKMLVGRYGY
jgi:UDP-N-acetylmuramoyl-L-alanyl-D-glutamate--2,6-diaminopimelate ligase